MVRGTARIRSGSAGVPGRDGGGHQHGVPLRLGPTRRALPACSPVWPLQNTTIMAALRTSGLCATALLDGPTNGRRFCSYVTETLIPVLQPGDIVVMDNLPAHKVSGVQDAIEAAGARLLYLPSYSPDFNPIEQAFAKLKALLRSAAARTIPDLWAAIRQAFTRFTPQECCNYLAAAGYENDLAVAT